MDNNGSKKKKKFSTNIFYEIIEKEKKRSILCEQSKADFEAGDNKDLCRI